MKINNILLTAWLLVGTCSAVVWHDVAVLQDVPSQCGYYAMANAACFVGVHGQVFSEAKTVDEKLATFGAVVAPANDVALKAPLAAWQPAVGRFRTTGRHDWATRNELNGYIVSLIPKFAAWRERGQLVLVDSIDKLVGISAKMKPLLDQGQRVGVVVDISSVAGQPHLIALGYFQHEGDIHVCTMNSVSAASSNPFADKADGSKSDIVVAIEKLFVSSMTSASQQPSTPKSPQTSQQDAEKSAETKGAKSASPSAFVGLINNGNMCYQNAVMQAMHKCNSLRTNLRARFDARVLAGAVMSPLVTRFFDVLRSLDGNAGAYNPMRFCVSLKENRPDFSFHAQQDASDFITVLWSRLQTAGVVPPDVQRDLGNQIVAHAVCDEFNGIAQQDRLVCGAAHGERLSPPVPNYAYMLALAMPAVNGSFTLNELLAHHIAAENMVGAEAIACPTCGVRTNHTKEVRFTIAPAQRFIMLQVKRFDFGGLVVKRLEPIILPANGLVTVTDSAGAAHNFRVAAVVVHAGGVDGGHYWTVTPAGVYNDSTVTADAGAMNTLLSTGLHSQPGYKDGTGYLYFLERV